MRPLAPALLLPAAALALACGGPARVDVQPTSLRFFGRGQSLPVHATPVGRNGRSMPESACAWTTGNAKVATVSARGNDAVVTSVGPGSAAVRCTIGSISAEVPVTVRIVAKVTVASRTVQLAVRDEPEPVSAGVQAFDDTGAPVAGRAILTRCANEDVCRGDARGQLWAVGPGDTTAVAIVEDAQSEPIQVHVVDARTAKTKPQRVSGNPMLEVERLVRERDAAEARRKANAK